MRPKREGKHQDDMRNKMRETEIRLEDKRSIETRKKLNKDEKKIMK